MLGLKGKFLFRASCFSFRVVCPKDLAPDLAEMTVPQLRRSLRERGMDDSGRSKGEKRTEIPQISTF